VAAAPAQADPEPPAAPAAEPTPLKRRHNFSAELLFRFGGYRVEDLTPQGHAEIVKLARVIKEQSRQVQSVLVQGHTDPMGTAASNLRISRERAETVRKILLNSGLPARKVQAEGRGSSDLLVTDCKPKATSRQDRLACNAPNRRVEILVINTKN
jgi:OOP family OmpA-OmpF porin